MQPKRPPSSNDPSRQIRIERPAEPEIASEDAGSWAVSYSDMLMVLMSFFVIFFSFSPKKTQSIISDIVLSLDGKDISKGGAADTAGMGQGAADLIDKATQKEQAQDFHHAVMERLKAANLNVDIEANSESVTINLPDSIYKPRGFMPSADTKALLDRVFAMVKPFGEQVDVYFVGHTDADPISNKNEYLSDNFSLSTLRATHALQHALKAGLPQTHLFAQGGAENVRNSRTLSVKVKLRPASPVH